MYYDGVSTWWDKIVQEAREKIERNAMEEEISKLRNHTQYYVPTSDLAALDRAMIALEEKFNAMYPDNKED